MIYFVKCGDLVKIGHTNNLAARMVDIKTDNPDSQILGVMSGSRREEIYLHYIFRDLRQRGEWFKLTQNILDYITLNTKPFRDGRTVNKKINQLAVVRGVEGLTQTDIAKKLGVSQQAIDKMEVAFERGNLKIDRLQIYLNIIGYEVQFAKKAS